jgi:hypothetical protein
MPPFGTWGEEGLSGGEGMNPFAEVCRSFRAGVGYSTSLPSSNPLILSSSNHFHTSTPSHLSLLLLQLLDQELDALDQLVALYLLAFSGEQAIGDVLAELSVVAHQDDNSFV